MILKNIFKDSILFFISFVICVFAYCAFFSFEFFAIAVSVIPSFIICSSVKGIIRERQAHGERKNFLGFMQYICSSLAAGMPVRAVLGNIENSSYFRSVRSKRTKTVYISAAEKFRAQRPFKEVISEFSSAFSGNESAGLIRLLSLDNSLGNRLLESSREIYDISRKLFMLEEEKRASAAQSRNESLLMILLPFAMAHFFRNIGTDPSFSPASPSYILLRIAAYILSLISAVVFMKLIGKRKSEGKSEREKIYIGIQKLLLRENKRPVPAVRKFYNLLPEHLKEKLIRKLRLLCPLYFFDIDGKVGEILCRSIINKVFFRFLFSQAAVVILGIFISTKFLLLSLPAALISASGLISIVSASSENEKSIKSKLPFLFSVIKALLKNGMSLTKALDEAGKIFADGKSACAELTASLNAKISGGGNAALLLEKISSNLNVSDASSLFITLGRFGRLGNLEILSILEKELSRSWDEQRIEAGKGLDMKNGSLLLSNVLSLISVMLIGAAPAVQLFGFF